MKWRTRIIESKHTSFCGINRTVGGRSAHVLHLIGNGDISNNMSEIEGRTKGSLANRNKCSQVGVPGAKLQRCKLVDGIVDWDDGFSLAP